MPTVLESLNAALGRALQTDERTLLLGEDLLDPYGGAFKVTRGLSTAFPGRVLTTPVSEAGIIGLAAGLALRGFRPVVEIMFGDFLTLGADQIVNHLAKFRWMYNDQVRVPLVIRAPMGGRRGYGPTHSQSLEKLFLGIPGLRVLAPSSLEDPGELLLSAILEDDDPVLFLENKLLYLAKVDTAETLKEFKFERLLPDPAKPTPAGLAPQRYASTYRLSVHGAPKPGLTLAAYGYMADLARQALLRLAYQHEVFAELLVPTQLSPLDIAPILDSVKQTHRLLAIEEGTRSSGWGAEVLARLSEQLGSGLRSAGRLAGEDAPIPASVPLENSFLPDVDDIVRTALELVNKE
jgi:pyruvate/2-oxoglutarate/acetoin dehydrogenase E1 component